MHAMLAAPGCVSFLFYPVDAFYCDAFDACNVFILQAFFMNACNVFNISSDMVIIGIMQNLCINQPIIQRCKHMQSYLLAMTGIYDCKLHA